MADSNLPDLLAMIESTTEQLQEIKLALVSDPDNAELLAFRDELAALISETQTLVDAEKAKAAEKKTESLAEKAIANGIFVGLLCEAVWATDGKYYKAMVDGIDDTGITVQYIGYGSTGKVMPEEIKMVKDFDAHLADVPIDGITLNTEQSDTSSGKVLDVPKALQILPTDSEKVRKMKKKRIKSLKLQNKRLQAEKAINESKLGWQDFNKKIGKKKTLGFLSGAKSESIFKTPDTFNGRVGVVGSGNKMTQQTRSEVVKMSIKTKLTDTDR